MTRYLAIRTVRLLATVVLVLIAAFVLLRLSGSPIERIFPDGFDAQTEAAMLDRLGLARPIHEQFFAYVGRILHGDFGRSLLTQQPVAEIYLDVLGPTLALGGLALLLSIVVALPLGVICAINRQGATDLAIGTIAFAFYATPSFVLAILMIYLFGYALGWLPTIGAASAAHYVMPVLVLALHMIASLARYTRGAMLDQLGEEYIRTARAKGIGSTRVYLRHALRNALVPIITIIGMDLQGVVNGSLIVESVFAWPGIGREFVGAVQRRDYTLFQFGILFYAAIVVVVNYVIDLAYVLLDPRIRIDA